MLRAAARAPAGIRDAAASKWSRVKQRRHDYRKLGTFGAASTVRVIVKDGKRLSDIRDFLKEYRSRITASVKTHLGKAGEESRKLEKEAFERRINEVAALQRNQSIEKLRREIDDRRNAARQFDLLEDADERAEREIRDLEDELKRRTTHFGDLLQRLKDEKERILERVIPSRFALRGDAQVFPVTVEIRFPRVQQ
jgi:hypothetical protein